MIPVMPAVLALVVLAILWSLYRFHLNPQNNFNLIDLLIEGGRASKVSCIVMGAFTLHSWVMMDLELHGKMTEGYLTIYGATWVSPILVRMVFNKPNAEPREEPAAK